MSYLGELRENDGRLVLKAFISPSKDVRAFILLVKLLQKLIPSNVVPSTWQFHEGMKEGSDVSIHLDSFRGSFIRTGPIERSIVPVSVLFRNNKQRTMFALFRHSK